MHPQRARTTPTPPAWLILPELREHGLRSANRALPDIANTIREERAALLSVSMPTSHAGREPFEFTAWDVRAPGVFPRKACGPRATGTIGRSIGTRLLDVFVDLSRRWPQTARPPVVGIISDGTGIIFHGKFPCGKNPEWLPAHKSGRHLASKVLDFDEDGYLAALCSSSSFVLH